MSAAIERLDRVPCRALVIANAVLSVFVAAAHGFAVALSSAMPESAGVPGREMIRAVASYTIPIAAVIVATALVALLWPAYQRSILALHAIVLLVGAVAVLVWIVRTLVTGFAAGTSVSWTPGMLTLICTYPVYLARRVFAESSSTGLIRKYVHVFVAAIVAPLDIAFGIRVLLYMQDFLKRGHL